MNCFRCGEPVTAEDACPEPCTIIDSLGKVERVPWHQECAVRSAVGSVGHLEGKCSCYGGTAEDPPGMTKRQAAKAAMDAWAERRFSGPKTCERKGARDGN